MRENYVNNIKKMLKILLSLVLVFTTLTLVTGCDKDEPDGDVDIYLDEDMKSMYVGEEKRLGYTTTDNGTGVLWTSSDSSIVSVDSNGVLRAHAIGTATITAEYNGAHADCRIEVRSNSVPATGVQLTTPSTSLEVGKTLTVSAKLTPSNTTDTLELTSSDDDIATITSAGLVKGISAGTVTITATSSNGKTATVKINILKPITGVTLNEKSLTLGVNETKTVIATVAPADASNKTVTWKTANASIATVDNGKITGKGAGSTTITATAGGKSAEVKVTVTSNGVKEIKLNRENIGLLTGATFQMYYVLSPVKPDNSTITWVSSNTNVATVDKKTGLVKAIAKGTATITATAANGRTAKCTVYVSTATVANSKVTAKAITPDGTHVIYTGESIYIQTKLEPANSTAAVTYTSGNTNIVTVDKNTGKVTGKGAGKTTVTVSAGGRKTFVDIDVKQHVTKLAITSKTKGVTISGTTITVDYSIAKSVDLTAVVTPTNASNKTVRWATQANNAKVASINETTGKMTINGPGNTTVTVKAQDGSNVYTTYQVKVINPANKITIKNGSNDVTGKQISFDINKNASVTLTKVVSAKTGEPTSKAVTWSSSNTSVATVNSSGKVTFKTIGTVTITATAKDGSKVSAKTTIKIYTGGIKTVTLDAPTEVLKDRGVKFGVKLEPSETNGKVKGVVYEWSSSNTAIATVNSSGEVIGKAAGKVKITVRVKWITSDLKNHSADRTQEITVKTKLATKIAFKSTQKTIYYNVSSLKTIDLLGLLNISPTDSYVGKLTWTSSSTKVATVDANGKVTAKGAGSTEITVVSGAITDMDKGKATIKIVVKKGVESIAIKSGSTEITKKTLAQKATLQLTADIKAPTDISPKTVTWDSSDKTVATVDANGKVTAQSKAGTAIITATPKAGGVTATVKITVK